MSLSARLALAVLDAVDDDGVAVVDELATAAAVGGTPRTVDAVLARWEAAGVAHRRLRPRGGHRIPHLTIEVLDLAALREAAGATS